MVLIFFARECAFCRQPVDLEDDKSFLAVSNCHPNPGRATWESPHLYIGRVTAIVGHGKPGVYLLHPTCIDIIKTPDPTIKCKLYFDCVCALEPILREGDTSPRTWPWS
jgi:hypothetical protein